MLRKYQKALFVSEGDACDSYKTRPSLKVLRCDSSELSRYSICDGGSGANNVRPNLLVE